ncbi:hypothetical protein OnM2_078037 [Erysiphe neolycopersici]|uniref:Uncharacterized protein n=1 Tax=Erysiphe neolycopersici TaxID=212602 RepID=A0A420HHJ5_9PEZI|nr:hypothetical protein OnM2_078037 [Erysiphe neolycopersici]
MEKFVGDLHQLNVKWNSAKTLPRGTVRLVRISEDNINRLCHMLITIDESNKPDDYTILPESLDDFKINRQLSKPELGRSRMQIHHILSKRKTYICIYALVLFLAGKLNDSNRSAITTAHPKALTEIYKVSATAILNVSTRISNTAHKFLHQAWLEMSSFIGECFGMRVYFAADCSMQLCCTFHCTIQYASMFKKL